MRSGIVILTQEWGPVPIEQIEPSLSAIFQSAAEPVKRFYFKQSQEALASAIRHYKAFFHDAQNDYSTVFDDISLALKNASADSKRFFRPAKLLESDLALLSLVAFRLALFIENPFNESNRQNLSELLIHVNQRVTTYNDLLLSKICWRLAQMVGLAAMGVAIAELISGGDVVGSSFLLGLGVLFFVRGQMMINKKKDDDLGVQTCKAIVPANGRALHYERTRRFLNVISSARTPDQTGFALVQQEDKEAVSSHMRLV